MSDEKEGVIKFDLSYQAAPAPPVADVVSLNSWRRILFLLRLIGQDPQRYNGFAYGNVSRRLRQAGQGDGAAFLISATQTGGLPVLQAQHYTSVLECDPLHNRVVARGPLRPSSECLTHATLYALDPAVQCVMHVHSPEIWRNAALLGIPVTDAAVAYGTPAMAGEVQRIFRQAQQASALAMGGHQDGVVSFANSIELAGTRLVNLLALALAHQAA